MTRSQTRCFSAVFVVLLAAPLLSATVAVHDPELNFSFSLPDGFEPEREFLKQKNVVQGFVLPPREGQAFGIFVLVERLGGTIGREPLGSSLSDKNLEVKRERWKSFTLDVVTVPETVQGTLGITLNVQIPLKPYAAQVRVAGERSREAELRGILRLILTTAEGPTNWLTDEERSERFRKRIFRLGFFLGIVGVFVYLKWYKDR